MPRVGCAHALAGPRAMAARAACAGQPPSSVWRVRPCTSGRSPPSRARREAAPSSSPAARSSASSARTARSARATSGTSSPWRALPRSCSSSGARVRSTSTSSRPRTTRHRSSRRFGRRVRQGLRCRSCATPRATRRWRPYVSSPGWSTCGSPTSSTRTRRLRQGSRGRGTTRRSRPRRLPRCCEACATRAGAPRATTAACCAASSCATSCCPATPTTRWPCSTACGKSGATRSTSPS